MKYDFTLDYRGQVEAVAVRVRYLTTQPDECRPLFLTILFEPIGEDEPGQVVVWFGMDGGRECDMFGGHPVMVWKVATFVDDVAFAAGVA